MAPSKAEKRAKKEAKRLQKLKAEAEARKKIKREELQREMAAQAMKKGEIDKTWKEMMLKIKEPVFKQDIEIMWHTFERAYDKKDHLIKYIIKLMNIADDQFQRTVASFCDTIDTMIIKFLADLDGMSMENNSRTGALLKSGEVDAAKISTDHDCAESHLQLLLYHAHTTSDALAWSTRGENLVKEDEDRNNYASERENLRALLENNYSNMWDDYKAVLKQYVIETADNQKQVRTLRVKENLMADIIASQAKKIANSDEMLKRLRTELSAYESGTKQAVFRDRRNRHRAACHRLKKNLYDGVAIDMRQLAKLVRDSDDAVEWLESAHKKVEKILRLAALCRKFETQREKVLPFGINDPYSPTQSQINVRKQQSDDSLVVNAMATTCGLTRLWQKISKVELSKRALMREKILLEHENAIIRSRITEYNENKFAPETQNVCLCTKSIHGSNERPVAIEGALEKRKFV